MQKRRPKTGPMAPLTRWCIHVGHPPKLGGSVGVSTNDRLFLGVGDGRGGHGWPLAERVGRAPRHHLGFLGAAWSAGREPLPTGRQPGERGRVESRTHGPGVWLGSTSREGRSVSRPPGPQAQRQK